MQSKTSSVDEYIDSLSDERKSAITRLRNEILKNIPQGFSEEMNYGMIGYVIPHSLYPAGYHCDPKLPLPFINIASQKNHIAIYHMGLYADKELLSWFELTYPEHSATKLDMGKSCIRFKKAENIPYKLIAQLVNKLSVEDWIKIYEKEIKK